MKLSEVPEEYKMYQLKMSNKDSYIVSGEEMAKIIASHDTFIRFPNGEGFNKAFIVNWTLDIDATRENVIKNRPKLLEEKST